MPLTSANGTRYPAFTVTNGTRTPMVWDLRFGSEVNGGYSTAEFKISNDERLAGGALWSKPYTVITITIASGESAEMLPSTIVWQGYLGREVTQSRDGACSVFCVGGQDVARTTHRDLLYRTDDLSLWMARDSDDANFPANYRHIDAEVTGGRPLFNAGVGAYGVNNVGGLVCICEGAGITKVTWLNNKGSLSAAQATAANSFAYIVRTFTPPLANGDTAYAYQIGVNKNVGNTAQGATMSVTNSGTLRSGVSLELMCTQAITLSETSALKLAAKSPKVYGIASSDSYYASTVMTHLAGLLNHNATGVVATTTPVLPVFWHRDMPLADLMDDMATFEAYFWRVLEKSGAQWKLQFSPWDGGSSLSTTYYADYSDIYNWDVTASADLFNAARVYYKTASGRRTWITVKADGLSGRPTDPFAGTDRANTGSNPVYMDFELIDRQPDSTLASSVGTSIVKDFAVQRYEGTLTLSSAHLVSTSGTEKPACVITAGDKIVIDGTTYRVYETDHAQEGPTRLTIGRKPDQFTKWVAQRAKKAERRGGG